VKGKGILVFKHHTMKAYSGETKYSSNTSLTSALYGGKWLVLCSGHFSPNCKKIISNNLVKPLSILK